MIRNPSLVFESSTALVEELMIREAFMGVVAFREGGPNNQGREPNGEVRVEVAPGLDDDQAVQLLREVEKALTQLLARPSHGS